MKTSLKIPNLRQKGGVSKTTTAISLATCACAEAAGLKPRQVCVIDPDPRAAADEEVTQWLES